MGELIAEAIALVIIIAFGDSVAAMIILYDPSPYANAYWGVAISWGLAVAMAIYATAAVSGTHANRPLRSRYGHTAAFPERKSCPISSRKSSVRSLAPRSCICFTAP